LYLSKSVEIIVKAHFRILDEESALGLTLTSNKKAVSFKDSLFQNS
jgi:hypothetical protein